MFGLKSISPPEDDDNASALDVDDGEVPLLELRPARLEEGEERIMSTVLLPSCCGGDALLGKDSGLWGKLEKWWDVDAVVLVVVVVGSAVVLVVVVVGSMTVARLLLSSGLTPWSANRSKIDDGDEPENTIGWASSSSWLWWLLLSPPICLACDLAKTEGEWSIMLKSGVDIGESS